jgi:Uma2 family endonuclease
MSTSTRITIEQYSEMIERGVFDPREDHHVELIEGDIVAMSPIGERHENIVDELQEWSVLNAPRDRVRVRCQNSIGLPMLASAPQPDIAWVRRRSYHKVRPQAADVFLIVEVSDSSLDYDRGQKAGIYATSGIADYWIVNIPDDCIEVRRDPQGGAYQSIQTLRPGDSIPLLAFPEIAFPVDTIFTNEDPA